MPRLPAHTRTVTITVMDKITLKNFRCFREEQTARLAPLTFLVGENSTGKTSFLALIRALWDVAFAERIPDFREDPYNLGSFNEIVHTRGGRSRAEKFFEAGFEERSAGKDSVKTFSVVFGERSASPFPVICRLSHDGVVVNISDLGNGRCQTKCTVLEREFPRQEMDLSVIRGESRLAPFFITVATYLQRLKNPVTSETEGSEGSIYGDDSESESNVANITEEEEKKLHNLTYDFGPSNFGFFDYGDGRRLRPFASAPVRTRPLRTYEPVSPWADPEGQYIPTLLASIYHRDPDGWQSLKGKLEEFGHESGLFDDISIHPLGRSEGTPFQVHIRKFSEKGLKGPQRNLIDVGYGVSQALPLLSELLRGDSNRMFLLQQPEVHLHPKAQAELGSLFCNLAGYGRQLIVETHSDYILDRVTMEIRDGNTALEPEDVSILYFEPGDLDVRIHSLRLDEMGNIFDAPPSYRQFFVRETRRSIGL